LRNPTSSADPAPLEAAARQRRLGPALAVAYAVVFGCFFVSGFCSLLYQVAWTRLAFAHFGAITPVLSLIVSVFMLGIGLGSLYGASWADRLDRERRIPRIYFYAATEALIALGAFAVPATFDWGESLLLRTGGSDSATYLLASAAFIVLAVLPWSTAMGATIPLMMAFVRSIDRRHESTFSLLYLANVLGGMLGALGAAFVLIELFGIRGTYLIGSACNVGIAATAAAFGIWASRLRRDEVADRFVPLDVTQRDDEQLRVVSWTPALLFTTGFSSLGLEIAWARDFTFSLLTTIYAFASILAVYLGATAIGSRLYRMTMGKGIPLERILGWLFVTALFPIVLTDPRLGPSVPRTLTSIVPFCMLLGFLTPSLIDGAARGDPKRTGAYYGINIAGSIVGPLVAGYFLLPVLGLRWTMIVLALPFLLLFACIDGGRLQRSAGIAATGVVLLLFCSLFARAYDDARLYRAPVEVRRDYVASVVATGSGMNKLLLVNSVGITSLTTVTKVMAHLPMALYGKPASALDICFGMGTTFRSLMSWGADTTAVDLSQAVLDSFGFFHSDAAAIVASQRGHLVADDGRRYLMRAGRTFDVITIDPPPPVEAAGSSFLYSEQFYEIVKSRLSANGILQQWIPRSSGPTVESVALALTRSFPYVRAFRGSDPRFPHLHGFHFIASMRPIKVPSAGEFEARMPAAARRDLLEWQGGKALRSVIAELLANEVPLRSILPPAGSRIPPISDDRPFNEYFVLRDYGLTAF
jgi:spermidine synthase